MLGVNEGGGRCAVTGAVSGSHTACTFVDNSGHVRGVGGTAASSTIFPGGRTVGTGKSGQSALQLTADARCCTRGDFDESGGSAPCGAVSVSDRSCFPASTAMVDGDESGQSALQLSIDESRRTRGDFDESGGPAPGGAVSVSDRSCVTSFETCRPYVQASDESGELAPGGAVLVSGRSDLAAYGVASSLV